MNILITGGCGFIGSHIVDYNLAIGNKVKVVDNLSAGTIENIEQHTNNPDFELYQEDLCSWNKLTDAVQWSDCIYNMAAVVGIKKVLNDPVSVIKSNFSACERLFDAIATTRSTPRVLLASSSMVYGSSNAQELKECDPLVVQSTSQGHWSYAVSKIANESIGYAYYKTYQIPITIMRIFNQIGPRQSGLYGMVVPTFIKQACTGVPITVYGDGSQSRSFCDVRDMAQAIDTLVYNRDSIGEIVNVGNNNSITMLALANLVKDRANSTSEIIFVSYSEAYGEEFTDIMSRKPNLGKFIKYSNYKFKWSLVETIDDLISRFRNKNTT